MAGAALQEGGVRTELDGFVGIASDQSELLQAVHLKACGGLVDVDERGPRSDRFDAGLECTQDDLVDLALPVVERTADRKRPGDVARVLLRRGGTGIVHHQLAGLHLVVVCVVVQHLAAHREDDRERLRRAMPRMAGLDLAHHLPLVEPGPRGAHRRRVRVEGDLERLLHLRHFLRLLGGSQIDDRSHQRLRHFTCQLPRLDVEQCGQLEGRIASIGGQQVHGSARAQGRLEVRFQPIDVATVGDTDPLTPLAQSR